MLKISCAQNPSMRGLWKDSGKNKLKEKQNSKLDQNKVKKYS